MNQRIGILDGFRALAIMSVMCFHYFSSWTPPRKTFSLYPYGSDYAWFYHGNLGVQFFFIISGFVIFFTVERTDRFTSFWKKRAVRLFPSMLIASLLTYALISLLDPEQLFPNSHSIKNLVTSLTFLSPDLLNAVFKGQASFAYLTNPYWSLWPEVQFYVLISVLYYAGKRHFLRNFLWFTVVVLAVQHVLLHIEGSDRLHIPMSAGAQHLHQFWTMKVFNLIGYLPYFAIGVFFYALFRAKSEGDDRVRKRSHLALGIFMAFTLYINHSPALFAMHCIMFALFLLFVHRPEHLSFLENRLVMRIGLSSYFIYLIHENIGVLLIHRFGHLLQPVPVLFTLLLMTALIAASIFYSKHIEAPFARRLTGLLGISHRTASSARADRPVEPPRG